MPLSAVRCTPRPSCSYERRRELTDLQGQEDFSLGTPLRQPMRFADFGVPARRGAFHPGVSTDAMHVAFRSRALNRVPRRCAVARADRSA